MAKKSVKGGNDSRPRRPRSRLKTESKAAPKTAELHRLASERFGHRLLDDQDQTGVSTGPGPKCEKSIDSDSDLAIVNVQTGAVSTSPGIADPDHAGNISLLVGRRQDALLLLRQDVWGNEHPPASEDLKKIMYDLMCVKYDVEKDEWGQPETVLTAAETGMSIGEPRASPDGRYPALLHGGLRQLLSLPPSRAATCT